MPSRRAVRRRSDRLGLARCRAAAPVLAARRRRGARHPRGARRGIARRQNAPSSWRFVEAGTRGKLIGWRDSEGEAPKRRDRSRRRRAPARRVRGRAQGHPGPPPPLSCARFGHPRVGRMAFGHSGVTSLAGGFGARCAAMRGSVLALLLAACGSPSGGAITPDGAGSGQPDAPGTQPDGPSVPIPIKHVVVIVKENHTFDNYFGSFPGAEGIVDASSTTASIACPHAPDARRAICATRTAARSSTGTTADGRLGRRRRLEPTATTSRSRSTHEADIPNYWPYAQHFTLGDHFFANVLGPSFPGHIVRRSPRRPAGPPATRTPQIHHPYWGCDQDVDDDVSILENQHRHDGQVFPCFHIPSRPRRPARRASTGSSTARTSTCCPRSGRCSTRSTASATARAGRTSSTRRSSTRHRERHAARGDLARRSGPRRRAPERRRRLRGRELDGRSHQPADAERLLEGHRHPLHDGRLRRLVRSRPAAAPVRLRPGNTPYGLGFRLPLIVISPYAKPGFVFKEVAEQASIPRFIEKVFGARDAARPRSGGAGRPGERPDRRLRLHARRRCRRSSCRPAPALAADAGHAHGRTPTKNASATASAKSSACASSTWYVCDGPSSNGTSCSVRPPVTANLHGC